MNGTIAQIVALNCHANAAIRGGSGPKFFPDNSTCKFCDSVTFTEVSQGWFRRRREVVVATTPDKWFEHLLATGANNVRLFRTPQNESLASDRMLAGLVGGGGIWTMEVVHTDGRVMHWTAGWDVWNQNAPEQRIWRVGYGGCSARRQTPSTQPPLADVHQSLLLALQRIEAFASQQQCTEFAESFQKAIRSLTTPERNAYHHDLAPTGTLPDDAEAILDACQSAWVFGGMGSWNDIGFDGDAQSEYESASESLFVAVTEAICAAVNSSCPAPTR
jgi:hypothetical protein